MVNEALAQNYFKRCKGKRCKKKAIEIARKMLRITEKIFREKK